MDRSVIRDFMPLLLREPRHLSDDETASIRYLRAAQLRATAYRRETAWLQRLDDLDDALTTGAPLDAKQTAWVKNQRRSDHLCALQMRLLEALPGWTWSPREDAWIARAEELSRFLISSRRAPRIRTEDPVERRLAYWLGRQLRLMRLGELSRTQVQRVASLLSVPPRFDSRQQQSTHPP